MRLWSTVPSDVSQVLYSGDGTTTVFAISFVFFDDTDIVAVLTDDTTAVETTLVLNTDYTVTGGDGDTGSATLGTAPASGKTLTLTRSVPYTQEIDFEPNDPFPADVAEEGFDRNTMLAQQNLLLTKQSPKLPSTYNPDTDGLIRLPLPEAGKIIVGKDDETGWENAEPFTDANIPTLITSVQDGDLLQYDDAASTWKNRRGLTTKGDLLTFDTALARLAAGSDGQILTMASGTPAWGMPLRGYLAGLGTSWASNTKINVAAGVCADSTNAAMLTLAATDLDCTTTGAGGMDTGSLAANTAYHLFVIGKTDGTTSVLASTSVSAPTMPTGYTLKRRIWSFLTDGSSHILSYIHDGDSFSFVDMQNNVQVTSPGTSSVLRSLSVPTGLRVKARLLVGATNSSGTQSEAVWVSDPSVTAKTPVLSSPVVSLFPTLANVAANAANAGTTVEVYTNTSSQVRSQNLLGTSTCTLNIFTLGWTDRRGRDA